MRRWWRGRSRPVVIGRVGGRRRRRGRRRRSKLSIEHNIQRGLFGIVLGTKLVDEIQLR